MRRILLMTAAAALMVLAACSDARTSAGAPDAGEARVYLLSGAEVVKSSLRRDEPRDEPGDRASACRTDAQERADACDAGSED